MQPLHIITFSRFPLYVGQDMKGFMGLNWCQLIPRYQGWAHNFTWTGWHSEMLEVSGWHKGSLSVNRHQHYQYFCLVKGGERIVSLAWCEHSSVNDLTDTCYATHMEYEPLCKDDPWNSKLLSLHVVFDVIYPFSADNLISSSVKKLCTVPVQYHLKMLGLSWNARCDVLLESV